MTFHDHITVPKPKKGEARGTVTIAAVEASLATAAEEFGDHPFGLLRAERSGDTVTLTYGVKGRVLDAAALAYELNN
ncbi:hypothetical protein [Mesorhizobium sp.]|uniref:hypothetical protein n=1 Tax=Mesorhizobium sp. TaxID=1871066 RepID=UPI000FE910E3|nr:hypothetical protein [Mesorhizobium sp.]RWF71876.1 MAG: hypothetical protein EOQ34_13965 [Mesorhizobium sp.]TIN03870.1 MAG: hypothetical protein E5Y38_06320 [Mesorhizobium sp.]TIQ95497.1 MAG: hypothetical protein E5X36_21865 [Mesorhizobium sp.]